MKQKLNVLLIVFAAANLFLLNSTQAQNTQTSKVYTVDEIIESAPTLVGKTVTVKGTVQHICEKTGRKLFLETADGKKTFRLNAGTKIDKFNENALDTVVIASGVVAEQKVTLEDLNKQEAAVAAVAAAEKAQKVAEHCTSEAKANGENTAATPVQRVQALKDKLKKQVEAGKNNYLSFYTIDNVDEYSIVKK